MPPNLIEMPRPSEPYITLEDVAERLGYSTRGCEIAFDSTACPAISVAAAPSTGFAGRRSSCGTRDVPAVRVAPTDARSSVEISVSPSKEVGLVTRTKSKKYPGVFPHGKGSGGRSPSSARRTGPTRSPRRKRPRSCAGRCACDLSAACRSPRGSCPERLLRFATRGWPHCARNSASRRSAVRRRMRSSSRRSTTTPT